MAVAEEQSSLFNEDNQESCGNSASACSSLINEDNRENCGNSASACGIVAYI